MTPRPKPTRSACFQPDNYVDLALFTNREELLSDLVERLKSVLEPGGPGQARILVRGHRGVGKSILTRKALDTVISSPGALRVIVDGAQTGHGPDAVLKRIAADLGREATENANDPALQKGAELLQRFAALTKVSVKEVRQWSRNIQLGAAVKSKLVESVQVEFGITGAVGRVRTVEESYERAIDADFLRDKVQDFLSDCRAAGEHVVLFVDNLDQVGYAEIEEDVRRVTDLAKAILGFRDCVVVANLRTEFVSADLRKLYSNEVVVKGLEPEELLRIAKTRMGTTGPDKRLALKEAGFEKLAATLASWTTNAWGYLSWLADLDYERIDFAPDDGDRLREALLRIAENRFAGLRGEEIRRVAAAFKHAPHQFLTGVELDTHGVTQELRERALRYGALVPDWLLSPDRYMLSPGLHFLCEHAAGQAP
ncbi:AAA family ATPase [Sorangium sp. So ce834]|uniref:AAA family ATPase n=1 Tax=Sorangium sp. So ce834 TaxID=3133321 RepID=UPI003F643CE2